MLKELLGIGTFYETKKGDNNTPGTFFGDIKEWKGANLLSALDEAYTSARRKFVAEWPIYFRFDRPKGPFSNDCRTHAKCSVVKLNGEDILSYVMLTEHPDHWDFPDDYSAVVGARPLTSVVPFFFAKDNAIPSFIKSRARQHDGLFKNEFLVKEKRNTEYPEYASISVSEDSKSRLPRYPNYEVVRGKFTDQRSTAFLDEVLFNLLH